MKSKLVLAVILLAAVSSCTKTKKPDFLYLNADQLKPLGIELNSKGVFYKNENPNRKQDHQKFSCTAFYLVGDNYSTSCVFNANDTLKAYNKNDSLLISKKLTKNDFYPLLIGPPIGRLSMDNTPNGNPVKLLPIAICMAETNIPSRKDTVIVWMKPTESLKKALPANIDMENYLQDRPIRK
jgi:hypothetical protein